MKKVFLVLIIFCIITAVMFLVIFKSVQFAWLFGLLCLVFNRLDEQFTKLAEVVTGPNGEMMKTDVKFLNLLKASFGLNKFWTWGFILITGFWIIIYIM